MNFNLEISKFDLQNYSFVFLVSAAIALICTVLVIIAIVLDFTQYHRPGQNKKKVNSWVETGTMFVYFFVYYLLMKPVPMKYYIDNEAFLSVLQLLGAALMILGCYVNIKGRVCLKHNWANQVTIYRDHTLITTSVYRWVRHPLYASLIWMFIGGSLIYVSYLSLLSVFLIFVPMMYYRAKQEEKLLEAEFPEYSEYKKRVRMFF